MNLRSTLEQTPENPTAPSTTPPVVMEVPATVNTLEEANAAFDAAFGESAPKAPSTGTTPTTAVVPAADLAMEHEGFADDYYGVLKGDFDASDIRIPNLRIVAGSGELSKLYPSGSTIFGDEVLLAAPDPRKPDPTQVFQWLPLTFVKSFREIISQQDRAAGVNPRFAKSAFEVQQMGGTTQWIGSQRPNWDPSATITVLIRKPANLDHPGFGIDLGEVDKDGKPVLYAAGVYYASGTAYREVAKLVLGAANMTLRVPVRDAEGKPIIDPVTKRPVMGVMLHRNWWTWTTAKKTIGEFSVTVPVVRMTNEQSSPELREYIAGFIAAQTA